jgi:hypothetical protein
MKKIAKLAVYYMAVDLATQAVKALGRRARRRREKWGGEPSR